MDYFAQNPYFCSQPKEVVGAEIFFSPHSAFQPFSSQLGVIRVEKRVEERGEEEEDDVEIIAAPKKRTVSKSRSLQRRRLQKCRFKVKVMEMEFVDGLI